MIKVTLDTRSWKKIGTKLDRMASRVEIEGNRKAVNAATTPMLNAARQLVPKVTGTLRKSLAKRVKNQGKAVQGKIGGRRGTAGHRYLHLVEFGTSHSSPRPFLRPAFYQAEPESRRIYNATIGDFIQSAIRRERSRG